MNARQILIGIALVTPVACETEPLQEEEALGQNSAPVTISDQIYDIRSVQSGKCAAVNGASQAQGASVVQLDCNGGASQRWQLRRLPAGTYEIKARHSGLCLAVATDSTLDGLGVVQAACSGGPNQQWLLVDASGALLIKPQTTGARNRKCMDVTRGSLDNLAAIIQWTCHGGANQRWIFAPVESSPSDGGTSGNPSDGGTGTGTGTGAGTGGGTAPGATTVTYAIDDTSIFANPERGFYHHHETTGSNPLSQSQLSGYRTNEAISLILRLFYLDSFRNTSISASHLSGISADFDRVRAAGLKAVLRFAYTSSMSKPYGDVPRDRILGHLAQLKPIFQANADIIATAQVGFVGAWGEWYYTDYFGDLGSISSSQWADRKAVVEALLASLPSTRTVQLRVPSFKKQLYGSTALTATEAFTGTAKARIGHHNDCFLASADDAGTYSSPATDKAYLGAENLYVPQDGETCVTSSYSGWANASADLEKLHYSYLNSDYNAVVLASWGSGLDVARRRLGYRLALVSGSFDGGARPGGELALSLSLRNSGYAPPYNPRGVEIIARHQTSGARLSAKLPVELRRLASGTTQRIDARLCVPIGTPEGTYALSLALPDPEPALHGRPEYAIRLANVGLWDAATGANSLKQNITISAGTASPTCSTGSIPLSP